MANRRERIVIIGGGQAGGRVAQILATSGRDFDITLVGREPHIPYNRPPLSKDVLLGASGFDHCAIWRDGDGTSAKVTFHGGTSVASIDTGNRNIELEDGSRIGYDTLVLATGSRVRQIRVPGVEATGVHVLRTFDQAQDISMRFHKGKRLMIVGGGFVGLEIAAAARARGLHTVVVEATDRLLSRIVPQAVGDALATRHREAGVSFRIGRMVEKFVASRTGALKAAVLSDGETIPCDLAVVGVGVSADIELAERAGLEVEVGIRTDSGLRTSDPHIYACGDVASFRHPLFERHVRVEAWQNAEEHARVVANRIMGGEAVCDAVPFFWSDQYELSMQVVGLPHFGSFVVTYPIRDAQLLYHLDAHGRLVGATALGRSEQIGRKIREARQMIAQRAHPDPEVLRTAPRSQNKALGGDDRFRLPG
jgi:3-phenylpropionate/trans-cinnamate dioxygenase ferredoxin reductase subunit